jgi:hypothetical protein
MRPPGRGDFWILKIAHAPSPKNLFKNDFCPSNGVAFLRKAFLQKNFQVPEKIPLSGYPDEATPRCALGSPVVRREVALAIALSMALLSGY